MPERMILESKEIRRAIRRMAGEIVESAHGTENVALIAILEGGAAIAEALRQEIAKLEEGGEVLYGSLDITLYRDDLDLRGDRAVVKATTIDFDIEGKIVVLVDDVLFTGRTVRAAMDALCDLGRPQAIRLAVLVDRGRREYPIQPDFVGREVPTSRNERVIVRLKPGGGGEVVLVQQP